MIESPTPPPDQEATSPPTPQADQDSPRRDDTPSERIVKQGFVPWVDLPGITLSPKHERLRQALLALNASAYGDLFPPGYLDADEPVTDEPVTEGVPLGSGRDAGLDQGA